MPTKAKAPLKKSLFLMLPSICDKTSQIEVSCINEYDTEAKAVKDGIAMVTHDDFESAFIVKVIGIVKPSGAEYIKR